MKIHTRIKRKYGLTSSQKHRFFFSGLNVKKTGAKTFTTEKAAHGYAKEKLGLKQGKYELVPTKKNKKFKVVSD